MIVDVHILSQSHPVKNLRARGSGNLQGAPSEVLRQQAVETRDLEALTCAEGVSLCSWLGLQLSWESTVLCMGLLDFRPEGAEEGPSQHAGGVPGSAKRLCSPSLFV